MIITDHGRHGVTLIALDDGATLSGLQRIVENDAHVDVPGGPGEGGDAPVDLVTHALVGGAALTSTVGSRNS